MENQFNIAQLVADTEKMKDKNGEVALERFALFFLLLYKEKAVDIAAWAKAYYFIISHSEHYEARYNKNSSALASNEDFQKFENMLFALAKADFNTALEFLAFEVVLAGADFAKIFATQYTEVAAARAARQARELEEKAQALTKKIFKKYDNVYKALA